MELSIIEGPLGMTRFGDGIMLVKLDAKGLDFGDGAKFIEIRTGPVGLRGAMEQALSVRRG